MAEESNVGQEGTESIRIAGVRISNLPIAEAAQAQQQMRFVENENVRVKIKDILKKYPPYQVPALEHGIRLAKENIERFEGAMKKERDTIQEFSEALAICKQRDKELTELGVKIGG